MKIYSLCMVYMFGHAWGDTFIKDVIKTYPATSEQDGIDNAENVIIDSKDKIKERLNYGAKQVRDHFYRLWLVDTEGKPIKSWTKAEYLKITGQE